MKNVSESAQREAESILSQFFWRLNLSEELQDLYFSENSAVRLRVLKIAVPVGLLFYLCYASVDFIVQPENWLIIGGLRLASSLLSLILFFHFLSVTWSKRSEFALCLSALSLIATMLVLGYYSPASALLTYCHGVVVILLYFNVVLTQHILYAVISTLLSIVGLVALGVFGLSSDGLAVMNTVYLFDISTIAVLSLAANYFIHYNFMKTFLKSVLLHAQQNKLNIAYSKLERTASLDGLTGVFNRQFFDDEISKAFQRTRANQQPLSLLFMDVDYFKAYNDFYGHPAGDKTLIAVAAAMNDSLRDSDLCARYGGEEFVIVLEGAPAASALAMGERVHKAVSALSIPHEKSSCAEVVTISVGVHTATEGFSGSLDEVIEQADSNLYRAKQAGRNCVSASSL